MTTLTLTTPDRCTAEKNKKIFATKADAENFEKNNRPAFGQQYPYECPHADHFHLASSPAFVTGAPQIKTTDWSQAKAGWQVVDPESRASKNELIRAALQRHNGQKTVKEIGVECGISESNLSVIYNIAIEHNLPYKKLREVTRPVAPVATLQSVQSRRQEMEAELKRLDDLEKEIIQREEEKRRVTVKIAANGNNANATMIFAGANGHGLWLTTEQADSLLAQLPGVIEDMKTRPEGQ
jgi:hypothetical protein